MSLKPCPMPSTIEAKETYYRGKRDLLTMSLKPCPMPTTAAIGGYMSHEEEDTCHMRRRIHAHHCSHRRIHVI